MFLKDFMIINKYINKEDKNILRKNNKDCFIQTWLRQKIIKVQNNLLKKKLKNHLLTI